MNRVCLDCHFSRATGCMAYCRIKRVMVMLSQSSCEMFKDGLARYRTKLHVLTSFLFTFIPSATASIGSDIGGALGKILTTCLVILLILVLVFVLWFLSWLFGKGGMRG